MERDAEGNFINFKEGPDGRIYVQSGRDAAVLTRQPDGSFATDRQLFSRFSADRTGAFYVEKDGVSWFGAGGRLVRFDTRLLSRTSPAYAALIRRVTVNQADAVAPTSGAGAAPSLDSVTAGRFDSSSPHRRSSTSGRSSISHASTASTPTGRPGRPSRGVTTRTCPSATTASTCGPGTS